MLCWGDIIRVQTRRVSQIIVFRYSEIGGRLCTKHRKKYYDTNSIFFNSSYKIYPRFLCSETRRVCTLKMLPQVVKMFVIVIVIFGICWLSYHTVSSSYHHKSGCWLFMCRWWKCSSSWSWSLASAGCPITCTSSIHSTTRALSGKLAYFVFSQLFIAINHFLSCYCIKSANKSIWPSN
jgi:hypothetical protein